jgi:hypothetical protein
MWSRFSEVLSFDNTYKTNRFKMPLFNITGLTNINSIFNAGFGLIYTERREGFTWLVEQVEAIRMEIGAALPKVGITDYDSNLKDALNETFPNMQQQICIFHINKNVLLKVKRKWKVPPGVVDVDDEDGPDAPRLADAEAEAAAAEGADNPPPPRINRTLGSCKISMRQLAPMSNCKAADYQLISPIFEWVC